jgi:hypothetical protein
MENFEYIYLLAIADNMRATLNVAGNWCFGIAMAMYAWRSVALIVMQSEEGNPSYKDRAACLEEYVSKEESRRTTFFLMCTTTLILWAAAALFPATENVLKAYALIEGSKVINAPNAELAAEAVGKRFDKFLDIVDRGITGRSTQSTPLPDSSTKTSVTPEKPK